MYPFPCNGLSVCRTVLQERERSHLVVLADLELPVHGTAFHSLQQQVLLVAVLGGLWELSVVGSARLRRHFVEQTFEKLAYRDWRAN